MLGRLAGPDPAAGYRVFALKQPNLYRLLVEHPLDDLGVPAGRRRRLLSDVLAALSPAGIADDAARDVWIQLHGSVAWQRINQPLTDHSSHLVVPVDNAVS